MKIVKTITAMVLSFTILSTQAQTPAPQGFTKGSLVLADGSTLTGYVKENIRRDASVTFMNETDKKKKDFDGNNLLSVEVDNVKYICIMGDFFKVVSEGGLSFLQKSSDASGKLVFNGLENTVSSGTEGRPGDYFIYNSSSRQLQQLSKKNVNAVASSLFAGCNAAIEKARSANGEIAMVKDAVEIFNNRNK